MPELLSLKRRKQVFYTLLTTLLVVGATYGYLLNQTVVQIVEHKAIAAKVAHLSTQVGELEHQYLAAQDSITLEHAKTLGFREITDPTYIARGRSDNLVTANVTPGQ